MAVAQTETPAALSRLHQAGAEAWPQLEVSREVFARFVERHHSASLPEGLDAAGLYLAAACSRATPGAVAAFEATCVEVMRAALRRLGVAELEVGDVVSWVMEHLLVGDDPKIAGYSGRGTLGAWARAVATRAALAQRRTAARRGGLLEAAGGELTPVDPELAYLKKHYRGEFAQAFGAAVEGLSARDRAILRYRFVDGLTLDQLAAACGVHRATGARWLAGLRERLLADTRVQLTARLKVGEGELDSIFRLIRSNFDVSVRGLLEKDQP